MTSRQIGGLATTHSGALGAIWFWLETAPPRLGFDDTDDPAVSLAYLHDHPDIYAQIGLVLLVMTIALIVAAFVAHDLLTASADATALRVVTAVGLLAAGCLFMHGVIRLGVQPLLYIHGLDPAWGQSAYVAVQMLTVHGFGQAAITALCLWAVGVSVIGWRTRSLPAWLAILGLVPALRLLGVLGPLGLSTLPDAMWIVFMATIPGVMVWTIAFGLVLMLRGPDPGHGAAMVTQAPG
jgi:hypothetical protein